MTCMTCLGGKNSLQLEYKFRIFDPKPCDPVIIRIIDRTCLRSKDLK